MRGRLSGVLGGPGEVREGYSRLLFDPRPYERMARYPVTQDHSARYRPLSAAGCSSAEVSGAQGGLPEGGLGPRMEAKPRMHPRKPLITKTDPTPQTRDGPSPTVA
jgi:hypothetical protein